MKPYFVVAGNYDEYRYWVNNARRSGSGTDYRYVDGLDNIRGQSDIRGIFIGTWYKRSDITSILVSLHMANRDNEPSAAAIIEANNYLLKLKAQT
jgi:hypothetical protein